MSTGEGTSLGSLCSSGWKKRPCPLSSLAFSGRDSMKLIFTERGKAFR